MSTNIERPPDARVMCQIETPQSHGLYGPPHWVTGVNKPMGHDHGFSATLIKRPTTLRWILPPAANTSRFLALRVRTSRIMADTSPPLAAFELGHDSARSTPATRSNEHQRAVLPACAGIYALEGHGISRPATYWSITSGDEWPKDTSASLTRCSMPAQ
ncbi:hypothetical protein AJ79_00926 [Helicocarpus griseus UAMH5409]|uniref:Uncharacterized protein n=1 Tax=Helicocarpus griseus UAMH5409 TaxID=1447875 RepID=A0A2B7Y960_9EURO|nr:hypothetical protein AJ79_00926 [Helicocarpus griseus UAMH5409]